MISINKTQGPQTCQTCIMDTSDPNIMFDEKGICNHCKNFDSKIRPIWENSFAENNFLEKLTNNIRAYKTFSDFDCIIGLSGGLDSSYTAYVAKEKMGLKPLLVHVDAGWNTDQAVQNISSIVDGLGLDLHTEVVDWPSIQRMQLAFFRAGIPDQDLVQDAVFFSRLYAFARKYKIKHVFTGSNFSTECCREPEEWGGYLGIDKTLFDDIWEKYGDNNHVGNFPIIDILTYKIVYQKLLGMQIHHPLNLIKYVKNDAEVELNSNFGWKPFKHKHHESRFTRFFEDFWLVQRFGFDKRRAHFSSLIMTQQMSRDTALKRISRPEMSGELQMQEFDYVASKLNISTEELNIIFREPLRTFHNFRNKRNIIKFGANILTKIGLEKRVLT